MAARGTIAKTKVITKIADAFGDSWIGEVGGKYYVWSEENGQKVQICIALTCPKTEVTGGNTAISAAPGDEMSDFASLVGKTRGPAPEITSEEDKKAAELLERLNMIF